MHHRYGRSKSLKALMRFTVVVYHCNCMPIFYRFRDYNDLLVANLRFFAILPTPVLFKSLAMWFLWI